MAEYLEERIDELTMYANDAFSEAERESDPKKAAAHMDCANKALDTVAKLKKMQEPPKSEGNWLTRPREFTWREVLVGIAGPIATIGAALIGLAGARASAKAQAETAAVEMQYKREMLDIITRKEEDDIVRTSGLKALNELEKL